MEFKVYKDVGTTTRVGDWHWLLCTKDHIIARCPNGFPSKEAARSNIAAAKKSMKAATYTKVVEG